MSAPDVRGVLVLRMGLDPFDGELRVIDRPWSSGGLPVSIEIPTGITSVRWDELEHIAVMARGAPAVQVRGTRPDVVRRVVEDLKILLAQRAEVEDAPL